MASQGVRHITLCDHDVIFPQWLWHFIEAQAPMRQSKAFCTEANTFPAGVEQKRRSAQERRQPSLHFHVMDRSCSVLEDG